MKQRFFGTYNHNKNHNKMFFDFVIFVVFVIVKLCKNRKDKKLPSFCYVFVIVFVMLFRINYTSDLFLRLAISTPISIALMIDVKSSSSIGLPSIVNPQPRANLVFVSAIIESISVSISRDLLV